MDHDATRPHLYLVDGSGFIFRAYFALPPMTRSDGTPVNAVYGFTSMLMKLLTENSADRLAVIFDAARKNFRNDIYPDYKAHRPDPPEDLIPQFDLIREATRAFHVPAIEKEGFEADDIIATYAQRAAAQGMRVTIVTSDKDLMQLMTDDIELMDPIKNTPVGREAVNKKFGVAPEKVVEVQALIGDASDNVPGVPGVGPKTAAALITEFGTLDNLLDNLDKVSKPKLQQSLRDHADMARVSKRLVHLDRNVPDLPPLDDLVKKPVPHDTAMAFLQHNGFRSLMTRLTQSAPVTRAPAQPHAAPAAPPSTTRATYQTVTRADQLNAWIEKIYRAGAVAVDTETSSLNARAAALIGVSLATAAGEACYIPLAHTTLSAQEQLEKHTVMAALKPVLEDPSILKIGQNLKYDYGVLLREGIAITPFDDTMLMSYALSAGRNGHGMDELAKTHLDYDTIKFRDVVGSGKKQKTFAEVDLDMATAYAAEDADITLRLARALKPQLTAEQVYSVYDTIDRPLIPVVAHMEQAGIKVDPFALHDLSKEFDRRLHADAEKIFKIAGRDFNIASPKQLGEVLFDGMGIPGGTKTKTGQYKTDEDVLEQLAASGHDIAQHVLDYRQMAKLKSTYTDALIEQINPDTKRIHTSFSLATTTTGRLSSSDPNLQNIPIRTEEGRKIRSAFVAEKGGMLVSLDYSQIELRLMAHSADVPELKQAFHDNRDIHAQTAAEVFGLPYADVPAERRRDAKAINFGIIYGISAYGLGRQLGIHPRDAQAFIDLYFRRYPRIRDYMEDTKAFARQHGYVTTLFGRKCHVPNIRDRNAAVRNFSERAAINAPLQGTAADLIKRAMIRVPDALTQVNGAARLVLQVHDELLFEVSDAHVETLISLIRPLMENSAAPRLTLSVPLVVGAHSGLNWDAAH